MYKVKPNTPSILELVSCEGGEWKIQSKNQVRVENSILKLIYYDKIPEQSYFEQFNIHSF